MAEISGMIQQFLEGNIKTLSAEPVIESKTITENGTYTAPEGVDGYSPVVVNVPPTEPVIESKTITENGTYTPESGVDGFAPVIVNVPPTEPVIESKNISENGTYTAPAGVDGYSPVIVNVPQPTLSTLEVSDNGDYDAPSGTAYNRVEVNVPLPENAYLLKDFENVPSDIVTFSDGANLPMPSLKVGIEPVQEGSGDPSPTNIRPISGWTACNVTRTGKNLLNPTIQKYSNPFVVYGGTIASNVPDGSLVFKAGTYTISINKDVSTIEVRDNPNSIIKTGRGNSLTFTLEEEKAIKIAINKGSADIDSLTFQLEKGSTATTYEPYNGHTTTIPFTDSQGNPIEVFGGECDVVNGGGSAYKEYDSYNGETLIGPWMSDRDVYAEGTTPTIGAQVVDMGAYDTDVATQPTAITTLLGDNNISADTGDIEVVEYFSKEV